MKSRSLVVILSAGLAAMAGTVPKAYAGEAAAYVVDYSATNGRIAIRRGPNAAVPVEIGVALEAGDVVEVDGAASATIDNGSGMTTILVAAGSPLTVEAGGMLGAARGEVERMMEIVRWQAREGMISARTRDSYDLTVPLLDVDAPLQKIVAGTRNLAVGWFDGNPPFRWEIMTKGQVVAESVTQSERWTILSGNFSSGPAELRVSDGSNATRVFPLEVVDILPSKGAEALGQARSPLGRIEAAATLSRIEKGAFVLEAFSLLSQPDATKAEAAMRAALAMGERP